eukprot:TRINITY_DN14672_c0_g1_i1.p1 TRINITY_DN14672_c0_g1~~TRINITY_DN14672_c0_g1_i1.p1  ORF type:complete len:338 (-),score=49.26 TRINITY_DN14672_c0_g1_i1:123-1136(-)
MNTRGMSKSLSVHNISISTSFILHNRCPDLLSEVVDGQIIFQESEVNSEVFKAVLEWIYSGIYDIPTGIDHGVVNKTLSSCHLEKLYFAPTVVGTELPLKFTRHDNHKDIQIICSDVQTPYELHRCVLAARSPYFLNIFRQKGYVERNHGIIKLQHISAKSFEIFVDYCYTDELPTHFEDPWSLLQLADEFYMPILFNRVEVSLVSDINVENVSSLYQKCLDTPFKLPYLKGKVKHFLAYNFYDVCNTTAYQELDREVQLFVEATIAKPGRFQNSNVVFNQKSSKAKAKLGIDINSLAESDSKDRGRISGRRLLKKDRKVRKSPSSLRNATLKYFFR